MARASSFDLREWSLCSLAPGMPAAEVAHHTIGVRIEPIAGAIPPRWMTPCGRVVPPCRMRRWLNTV